MKCTISGSLFSYCILEVIIEINKESLRSKEWKIKLTNIDNLQNKIKFMQDT